MWVIGDVHGKVPQYLNLISNMDYSIQLGDFSFNYDFLEQVDSKKHKFFMGNHDNYGDYNWDHNLGDFGPKNLGGVDFFFVRGGHSIDKSRRSIYVDWFPDEELNMEQSQDCLEMFHDAKPEIVITHEAPSSVTKLLFPNTTTLEDWGYDKNWSSHTQQLLQSCLDSWTPKLWVFGHMHSHRDITIKGTRFVCLDELETIEI